MTKGLEHIKNLNDFGINNMNKNHKDLIDNKTIELVLGDGRIGYKDKALYKSKCIHVGETETEVQNELIDQLALGARLVITLGYPMIYIFLL